MSGWPESGVVVTPAAPIPSGAALKVTIACTGRPGVHSDGDETTEGWLRSNNPVNDGPFVTTATMDQQEDITNFQSLFNGPFPFASDGVIIGTPAASFEEEMGTKITFAAGRISLGTFHHENMHQWRGDNVAASLTRYTFLKEGMATLRSSLATARTAANTAGGTGWTMIPSDPTPDSLFNNGPTDTRPGASYTALRQILGAAWRRLLQRTQRDFGGGNVSEAQMEKRYRKFIPNQSPACAAKLDEFFRQWWDTSYLSHARRHHQAADHRAGDGGRRLLRREGTALEAARMNR
jgi:hypothetical protein